MYQVWSFWDKEFLSYPFRKVLDTNMTFDIIFINYAVCVLIFMTSPLGVAVGLLSI